MAFPIDSPLPIFYDRNGDVLDAGYVYIGTPNLNPITSPVSVYWDAAQTIPAPQPLRTVRGFIARNGAPAPIYVATDYSIVVRDRNQQLVVSLPNSAQIDGLTSVLGNPADGFGADLVANADRSFATIAAMRAHSIPVAVDGRTYTATVHEHTSGTGKGGGDFRWDAASVVADDNGRVINPTGNAGAGRWIRIVENDYTLDMFGVDATGASSASAAIQTALNSVSAVGGGTLRGLGLYSHDTGSITIPGNVVFKGEDGVPAKQGGAGSNVANRTAQINITTGEGATTTPAFIVSNSGGMEGWTLLWPNQSRASVSPLLYGWAITTTATSSSADNISIRNMMIVNPYWAINMDNGAQWIVENIYGQPLNIGLRCDRNLDVSIIRNIHWWDFWALQADAIHPYIEANSVGFIFGRMDGVFADELFGWYLNTLIQFTNLGNGTPWINVGKIQSDFCQNPVIVDSMNKIMITKALLTTPNRGFGTAAVLVKSTASNADTMMEISELQCDLCTFGVIVENGAAGSYRFPNIECRTGTNLNAQYALINEGSADVRTCSLNYAEISGLVRLDSMAPLTLDADITPAGFATPDSWPTPSARCTSIAGGSRFDLVGATATVTRPTDASLDQEVGLFVLEFDIKLNLTGTLGAAAFRLRINDGVNLSDNILPSSSLDPYYQRLTRLRVPFLIRNPGYVFQFVFGGSSATSATIDMTNIKVWRVNPVTMDPAWIGWVQRNWANGNTQPSRISVAGSSRVTRQTAAPTAGTHAVGDRTINIVPTVGQPKAWVCTVAGTPGTWVSEGNL